MTESWAAGLEALFSNDSHALEDREGILVRAAEESDAYWSEVLQCWVVLSQKLMTSLLKGNGLSVRRREMPIERLALDDQKGFADVAAFYEAWLLVAEPEFHLQARRPVQDLFNPRSVSRNRWMIERSIAVGVKQFVATDGGDAVKELAAPIASRLLLDLLCMEQTSDADGTYWADVFFNFFINRQPTLQDAHVVQQQLQDLMRAFDDRKGAPDREKELKAYFAASTCGHEAAAFSLLSTLVDGIRPLAGSIATALYFATHAEDASSPIRSTESSVGNWISDTLRHYPHFQYLARRALRDIDIGGQTIRTGDRVIFMLAPMNLSACPTQSGALRLAPSKSMEFGYGNHACVGSFLAKETIHALLTHLIDNEIDLAPGEAKVNWLQAYGLKELVSLPLRARVLSVT